MRIFDKDGNMLMPNVLFIRQKNQDFIKTNGNAFLIKIINYIQKYKKTY